jgi:integrase
LIVIRRAGLRIQEALALTEGDLDHRRGALLVRRGQGGRRTEVGMDAWGCQQLAPWLDTRRELSVGPQLCVINGAADGTGRPRRAPSCGVPPPWQECGAGLRRISSVTRTPLRRPAKASR